MTSKTVDDLMAEVGISKSDADVLVAIAFDATKYVVGLVVACYISGKLKDTDAVKLINAVSAIMCKVGTDGKLAIDAQKDQDT